MSDGLWVGIYEHEHGTDTVIYSSKEAVVRGFADTALTWIDEIEEEHHEEFYKAIANGDLQEAVDIYFENRGGESYDILHVVASGVFEPPTLEEIQKAAAEKAQVEFSVEAEDE